MLDLPFLDSPFEGISKYIRDIQTSARPGPSPAQAWGRAPQRVNPQRVNPKNWIYPFWIYPFGGPRNICEVILWNLRSMASKHTRIARMFAIERKQETTPSYCKVEIHVKTISPIPQINGFAPQIEYCKCHIRFDCGEVESLKMPYHD